VRVTAMTPTPQTSECPKCGSNMQADKHLQSLGSETALVSHEGFLGDQIRVFYCEDCVL
jgi:predicted nucleic-acid-binding Zn-ribbon protein